jgi:vitamin B12 transporter
MMGNNPGHPFAPVDALNYTKTTEELYTRGFSHLNLFENFWEQTFAVAFSQTNREYVNWDPTLPYDLSGNYLGNKIKGDWQNIFHLDKNNLLMAGLENEEDTLENQSEGIGGKSYNTQGYYLSDQFTLFERSFTTASVRYSDNNRSGSKATWSLTEAVLINETGSKLKGNVGTGFKVPTLYELYAPFFGNQNLKSETSFNWDVGFEQGFLDQTVKFGATYFSNQFNNLIQADPTNFWIAENINSATAQGIEAFFQINPLEDLTIRGNYTFDATLDEETGNPLLNRPENKGNFEANYRFLKNADLNLVVIAVGEKDGVLGTRVPAYAIANLAGSYQVHPNVKLFARIDNLFNKEYQEVYGYGTTRLAGYGGVSLTY